MADSFYNSLGIGVASLTFGVALSIFIYALASGAVATLQAGLLFLTSFLLMLRFWWRYTELFVRYMPSSTFWHFLFDFAVSFFGILAVLFVGSVQTWSLVGALAMAASAIRCGLSWKSAKAQKKMLRKTLLGSVGMFVLFDIIYGLAPLVDGVQLACAVLVLVVIFVAYSSREK